MKLKKIASLALAGIMAVSMLAACGDGTGSSSTGSSSSEVTVSNSLADKVIAALDSNTTKNVTFSAASDRLNTALKVALQTMGGDNVASIDNGDLLDIDGTLGKATAMPKLQSETNGTGTDSQIQKFVYVFSVNAGNDDTGAYKLAEKIDGHHFMVKSSTGPSYYTWKDLPAHSNYDAKDEYCWDFEYTAEIAVTKVTNGTTNATSYIAAYVVTRTPTKHTV